MGGQQSQRTIHQFRIVDDMVHITELTQSVFKSSGVRAGCKFEFSGSLMLVSAAIGLDISSSVFALEFLLRLSKQCCRVVHLHGP